ncbi:MAG: metallophosphoesterase family protein [Caldilineaceae bacterium]
MRIAILSDIHGNLPAFEAALRHARVHAPDLIAIAGDIVIGAPDSAACWQLAQSLGAPILRGNHERYLGHFGTEAADPLWSTDRFAPLQWAVTQFSTAERHAIADLPMTLRLPNTPDLLLVHAAVGSDRVNLPPHTPDAEVAALFPNVTERCIVRGHDHLARTQPWRDKVIVTNGAVGLPMDANPAAQYVLLDATKQGWHIQHQAAAYDLNAAIDRFRATDYVAVTGPMGRLFFRELVTATPHLVPFLRFYQQVADLPLATAVERFLTHF